MNRFRWMLILMVIDAVLVGAALYLALWLRFDGDIPGQYILSIRLLAPLFMGVLLVSFYIFGLYNRLWQYASMGELFSILVSVTVGSVINSGISFVLMQGDAFLLPRSIFALHWMLSVLFVGGFRFSWRFMRGWVFRARRKEGGRQVLIVGAGDAGATVARELTTHNGNSSTPVGFVDDDPAKQKMGMFGLPVLGSRQDIPRLVKEYAVDEIVIAMPSALGSEIRVIVDICQTTSASLKILPGIYELIDGRVSVNQLREVQVEDMLGREPVELDLASMAGYLSGRIVLVTGAGGSIGSELCRQIARFEPSKLILLGHGENSIYEIRQELDLDMPAFELVSVIADVKDDVSILKIFQQYRPQVVFHAAAHKHVPLMEDNPAEAVKNNILGTHHVARAADSCAAGLFILVSTDKAVNPTSIMGATKRVAEMVIQKTAAAGNTCYAAVRFGNVLDSRGSVGPLFKSQIARGGPVTVTDPEMTRYFMTIPEAVQLVIQAGAMARGGEVFILDMGEPMNILSLARRMIRLAGYEPGKDIEIVFTGIRPGEKLREELLTAEEGVSATLHQRIFAARPDGVNFSALDRLLRNAGRAQWNAGYDEVVELLQMVLPGFASSSSLTEQKQEASRSAI